MHDLTLIYYTDNKLLEPFAENVRRHLIDLAKNKFPIISVTQKPVDLGENICVGEIGSSIYNCAVQIMTGVENAKTKFIACCEHDMLYPIEHFEYRPPSLEIFSYNINRWTVEPSGVFRWRNRATMSTCIVSRQLMLETLQAKFKKFTKETTDPNPFHIWSEPGRHEKEIGMPRISYERRMHCKIPIVTFTHRNSLGGMRKWRPEKDKFETDLPPWGNAKELWRKMHV